MIINFYEKRYITEIKEYGIRTKYFIEQCYIAKETGIRNFRTFVNSFKEINAEEKREIIKDFKKYLVEEG